MEVKDLNGNIVQDGDSVTVIKDLKVKGSSDVIKRGTLVKNIKLSDSFAEIDYRVNKTALVLQTEFIKKMTILELGKGFRTGFQGILVSKSATATVGNCSSKASVLTIL